MDFSFYVDDNCLIDVVSKVETDSSDLKSILELIDLVLDTSKATVFVSEDCLTSKIGNESACDFVYGTLMNTHHKDLSLELQVLLDRMDEFDPDDFFHDDYDDKEDGGSCAYLVLKTNRFGALIGLYDSSSFSWWDGSSMTLIDNRKSIRDHYRKIFNANYTLPLLDEICMNVFDNIYFHSPIKDIDNIGVCINQFKDSIIKHLSYLNDSAQFDYLNDSKKFINKAGSAGIDLSPESPNTHSDKEAMKARTIQINGHDVVCEWHTKITPTKGRIHFHFGSNLPSKVSSVTEGKLIVSAFVDHFK